MNEQPTARGGKLGGLISDRTRERAGALLESFPLGLGILIVAGLILRMLLATAYQPTVLAFADTAAYVNMANEGLFSDPARPIGYSLILRAVHLVSTDLETVITLQHLLGLLTGVVIYATVRRVGAPVWAGLIAAAAILLSLDQIYLEHSIASEASFALTYALALYCGVRALGDPRPLRGPLTSRHLWLLATGLLLGGSSTIRAIGAPLIPFLALWAVIAIPGSLRIRVLNGALTAVPAIAILLVYFAANNSATGTFGITQASGWSAYSRTAPFADCTKFDPPAGTAKLCETKPVDERYGPDFYTWQPKSPAQKLFGYPPAGNDKLAEFGRAVILGQPLSYAKAVSTDFVRYFAPSITTNLYGGADYGLIAIDRRDPPIEQDLLENFLNPYYDDEQLEITAAAGWLTDAQQLLRVHPIFLLQALILAIWGAFRASGRVRWAIVLTGGAGLVTMVLAVATSTYNARYVIPVEGPLIAAGVLGFWVLLERYRTRTRLAAATPKATAA